MVVVAPVPALTVQLLREWPPGYGGIERVAHQLAAVWRGTVFSLDAQPHLRDQLDALPVNYPRRILPRFAIGRLLIPWPSKALLSLLNSAEPLHGHLPSPGVLLILVLARLMRPHRRVTAHWHCFLELSPGFNGRLFGVYQRLALFLVAHLSGVVTTSPLLAEELDRCGCQRQRVHVLPCCLSAEQEINALALPLRHDDFVPPLRLVFIGRLESYKRLDWLLQSLATLNDLWTLDVVGDGPLRAGFEEFAKQLFGCEAPVKFHGRLDERDKLTCLAGSDLLVLPSDRTTEAFGIVQLEAMAAGIPALAFQRPRSGMGWVGQLPGLVWSQQPEDLAKVLQRFVLEPSLRAQLACQARQRYKMLFVRKVWRRQLDCLF